MKIAVCAATYLQPEDLTRLTEDLDKLTIDTPETPSLEVIAADNDTAGSVYAFSEEIHSYLEWPRKCSVEPRSGIPYARSRAVACAQKGHLDFHSFT
jgi:succinoglycan biosynthesis protein ExoM